MIHNQQPTTDNWQQKGAICMRHETCNMKQRFLRSGQLSIQVLLYGAITIIALTGFLTWTDSVIDTVYRESDRAQALAIAEAGIEYYRWHLAHAPQDFQDGTGQPGPYVHEYTDKSGTVVGTYTLDITPPVQGSTIVTIDSTGKLAANPDIEKVVRVRMGIPSFAKYAAVLNAAVRFGSGTEVFGEIHSNGGIRFDGIAHNLVTSAQSDYGDPDHTGQKEFGVHTHVNPPPATGVTDTARALESPPNDVADRSDVFLVGRQFPVPAVDFAGIASNLSQMKIDAQASGFYRPTSTTLLGYEIVLKTNDTFDLHLVTALVAAPSYCSNALSQDGWGTWSISTKSLLGNYPMPTNGLIFIEDNVWVSGQIDGARVTIAAARFPDNVATRSSITVNDNLLYTNYTGNDVISLIAQKNINIGMVSVDTIRIDAALMAQNGRVGRYYYEGPTTSPNRDRCSPYHARTFITSYGMLGSNQRYGFAYTDGTGYVSRNLVYDTNLLYGPPPSFPLTTDAYKIVSWDEVK
ncbi:hypothetical protein A2524_00855 [Candidatus Wolfebacteria bacterium RIFOXYD12_FULL_48_21]|uniref:Uncharacterized protein n=1 Tax=Candidatus Wolfebacteria bacterium RIFOXYD1_FULL_48_65 TaxID=1802561 RepID=A0A1F8E0A9_9BACT|nr:MAG: hypothetical protein A2610_02800 [Candidatus Wolfebacteria bacterium RIFOXYD1_FULL_48_65]OGM94359.1 MAG: hypothetical protein A2524_00855 [Candidatus Wolfebacteria bacterium RIFOXYD12_FULL_48_21]